MFSAIARWYDLNNTVLSFGLHHRWKREAVARTQARDGQTVLDLCSGTCDLALLLGERVGPTGRVIACDLNAEMLAVGRSKVEQRGRADRISCVLGNAEALQFHDASFDALTVAFGIRNVTNIPKALAEMSRVLKPGARAVCLEFSRPTTAILRKVYDSYSFSLLPKIGTWIARDRTGVYQYLPDSIRHFPPQEEFARMWREAGFSRVEYVNYSGGIVAIHVGVK
ncbi:MAG: bifunctional demethylmenaquinone methyltransferase/2-methoxy-6-polyprenyl-1,4-benzoquinol methylase UbiE [Nitrospirae bacterium]|nr:bifunctional demethylmenaquinone methyltransferase/2-methoxy-6-polyprenyl-1,4-benzoquinol methylase UbiE [Nitrospirota bacterium]